MAKNELENQSEVIKTIELDNEILRRLRLNLGTLESIEKAIPDLITGMYEEINRKRQLAWDELAEVLGFSNEQEIDREGYFIHVQWIRGSVELRRHKDGE